MQRRSIFSLALWIVCVCPLFICVANAVPPAKAAAPSDVTPYPPNSTHAGPAWFVDEGQAAGLTMLNVNGGVSTKKYIIETTGSGVAVIDYDNDGWPDILVVNGTSLDPHVDHGGALPTGHLYHNNQDGTFRDVTREARIGNTGWGQGACVGDYDNDGYDDLYVTAYGINRLYHNQHDGTFKEVAREAGVAGDGHAWSTGCAFVDYDRDGELDLVVATYVDFDVTTAPQPGKGLMCIWKGTPVMCGPRGLAYTSNLLYHNLGGGKFADVSKASNIQKTYGHYCFSITTLDYDQKTDGRTSMSPATARRASSITTTRTEPSPMLPQVPESPSTKTGANRQEWAHRRRLRRRWTSRHLQDKFFRRYLFSLPQSWKWDF